MLCFIQQQTCFIAYSYSVLYIQYFIETPLSKEFEKIANSCIGDKQFALSLERSDNFVRKIDLNFHVHFRIVFWILLLYLVKD